MTASQERGRLGGRSWGKAYVPLGLRKQQQQQQQQGGDATPDEWCVIEGGLAAVEGRGAAPDAAPISFDRIYREVVGLVEKGRGAWLYERLVEAVSSAVQRVKAIDMQAQEEITPSSAVAMWARLEGYVTKLHNLTSYLDVQWVRRNGVVPLLDVARAATAASIVPTVVGSTIRDHLVSALSLSRLADVSSRHLDESAVDLAKRLPPAVYTSFLEDPLCRSYAHDAELLRQRLVCEDPPLSAFVGSIRHTRGEFVAMCERVGLPQATRLRLLQLILRSLLESRVVSALVDKLPGAVAERDFAAISTFVTFANEVDAGVAGQIHAALVACLASPGLHVVPPEERQDAKAAMQAMVTFWKFSTSVAALFQGDMRAQLLDLQAAALNNTEAPEVVVRFVDWCMRHSDSDDVASDCWKDFAPVYRLLHHKDHVDELCRRKLASRLLQHRETSSVMSDALCSERSFVALFKVEQPSSPSVRRMEEMLKDIGISYCETQAFHSSAGAPDLCGTPNFLVLNLSAWPSFVPLTLPIHRAFADTVERFTSAYVSRHTGRSLRWCPQLGSVTLSASLEKRHEVVCGLLEATLLMNCFGALDCCPECTVQQALLPYSGASPDAKAEARGALRRLIGSKVVVSSGSAATPADGDTLTLRLQHKVRKVHVRKTDSSKAAAAEGSKERLVERKALTEAAIVRVMKSRRTLHFNELMSQVVQQLMKRFKPDAAFLKRRLEELLSRGYLNRSEEDRHIIVYEA